MSASRVEAQLAGGVRRLYRSPAPEMDRGQQGRGREDRLRGIRRCKSSPGSDVGGGPVGLALAGELGWRGVACALGRARRRRDRHPEDERGEHPHYGVLPAMGHRRTGARCPFPPDYPLDVAFVTSLSGYELGRMPRPPRISKEPEPHSPMRLQACSQMWFDPILQRFARTFPHVDLRYRTRLESFEDIRERRDRGDCRSRKRPARAHRGRLSGGVRRCEQHGPPRARYRAQRQDAWSSGASILPCTGAARRLRQQAGRPSSSPSIVTGRGPTFAWSIP